MSSSEIACYKVAILKLYNSRGMGLREVGVFVEELILYDCGMRCRDIAFEVIAARTNLLCGTIGQTDFGSGVARNLDIPLQMLKVFLPTAGDCAVRRVEAYVCPFAIQDIESGFEHNVLISIAAADTTQILVAPGEQVAQ